MTRRVPGTAESISVVIPVRNDPVGVVSTLHALMDQEDPGVPCEIIVVDNASADATADAARRVAEQSPGRVRVLHENRPGSYAARNTGIAAASGAVLSFVDADVIVPRHYLRAVVELMTGDEPLYVGCEARLGYEAATWAGRYDQVFGFPVQQSLQEHAFLPTLCLSVHRAIIEDVGPFDAQLESGGDCEFGQRVAAAGYRQVIHPNVVVHHPPRTSWSALVAQRRRTGRGLAQLRARYSDRFSDQYRRELSPAALVPAHPGRVRERMRRRQVAGGWGTVAVLSAAKGTLAWIKAIEMVRESRRLRHARAARCHDDGESKMGKIRKTVRSWVPPALERAARQAARWLRYAGSGYYCPCCRRSCRRFRDFRDRPQARCPWCDALERHRYLGHLLTDHLRTAPSPLHVLHIAPEVPIRNQLRRDVDDLRYVSLDLQDPADVHADITQSIPFADASFDLVIASHVLEHVYDDRAAMKEIRRVTRGTAMLLVPLFDVPTTVEDPDADEQERLERFGRADHVRMYGWDFVDRLTQSGFTVEPAVAADHMAPEEAARMRLPSHERVFLCQVD